VGTRLLTASSAPKLNKAIMISLAIRTRSHVISIAMPSLAERPRCGSLEIAEHARYQPAKYVKKRQLQTRHGAAIRAAYPMSRADCPLGAVGRLVRWQRGLEPPSLFAVGATKAVLSLK
jgi:hypothetical protein